jgi:hypothetical protein
MSGTRRCGLQSPAWLPDFVAGLPKSCGAEVAEKRSGQYAIFVLEPVVFIGGDVCNLACGERNGGAIGSEVFATAFQDVQEFVATGMTMVFVQSAGFECARAEEEVVTPHVRYPISMLQLLMREFIGARVSWICRPKAGVRC